MGNFVFQPAGAWAASERLLGDESIHYQDGPAGLETQLKSLPNGAKASRDFWTDAYLAAFALSAGMRLVSFDSGFTRFKDLDCLILD